MTAAAPWEGTGVDGRLGPPAVTRQRLSTTDTATLLAEIQARDDERNQVQRLCGAQSPRGYRCTLLTGHAPYAATNFPGALYDHAAPDYNEWWNEDQAPAGTGVEETDARAGLADWWRGQAEADLAAISPKISSYGSYDLDLIGRIQADMLGIKNASREVREELGCLFYLIGKVARMASAYREGHRPSDDSLMDAEIYVKMMRRIRAAGGWPHGADS